MDGVRKFRESFVEAAASRLAGDRSSLRTAAADRERGSTPGCSTLWPQLAPPLLRRICCSSRRSGHVEALDARRRARKRRAARSSSSATQPTHLDAERRVAIGPDRRCPSTANSSRAHRLVARRPSLFQPDIDGVIGATRSGDRRGRRRFSRCRSTRARSSIRARDVGAHDPRLAVLRSCAAELRDRRCRGIGDAGSERARKVVIVGGSEQPKHRRRSVRVDATSSSRKPSSSHLHGRHTSRGADAAPPSHGGAAVAASRSASSAGLRCARADVRGCCQPRRSACWPRPRWRFSAGALDAGRRDRSHGARDVGAVLVVRRPKQRRRRRR